MNHANDTLPLKILEAYTRDVGRGVARIDYESMDSLSASTGDVVEIRGKRRTVAKCLPSDEGKGIIRDHPRDDSSSGNVCICSMAYALGVISNMYCLFLANFSEDLLTA